MYTHIHAHAHAPQTVLEFSTRFPLMGGWKVDFKIGAWHGLLEQDPDVQQAHN
jgi:hypothetical protein